MLNAAVRAGHVRSKGKPRFWVTEFSWDSKPPDPQGVPTVLHTRWVAEALYRMWLNGVSLVTWFSIRDQPLAASYYQSGLFYRGGTVAADRPKPALRAFRFPFVGFVERGGVRVWGRTPGASRARWSWSSRSAAAGSDSASCNQDGTGSSAACSAREPPAPSAPAWRTAPTELPPFRLSPFRIASSRRSEPSTSSRSSVVGSSESRLSCERRHDRGYRRPDLAVRRVLAGVRHHRRHRLRCSEQAPLIVRSDPCQSGRRPSTTRTITSITAGRRTTATSRTGACSSTGLRSARDGASRLRPRSTRAAQWECWSSRCGREASTPTGSTPPSTRSRRSRRNSLPTAGSARFSNHSNATSPYHVHRGAGAPRSQGRRDRDRQRDRAHRLDRLLLLAQRSRRAHPPERPSDGTVDRILRAARVLSRRRLRRPRDLPAGDAPGASPTATAVAVARDYERWHWRHRAERYALRDANLRAEEELARLRAAAPEQGA